MMHTKAIAGTLMLFFLHCHGDPRIIMDYARPPKLVSMNGPIFKNPAANPLDHANTAQTGFEADDLNDEVVDAKLEALPNGEMTLEMTSHGRTHKLHLKESRTQLRDVPTVLLDLSEAEQEKTKQELQDIKIMTDQRLRASIAVKVDPDGNVEPIIHNGHFSLGKNDFTLSRESSNKVRIKRGALEELKFSNDGVHVDLNRPKRNVEEQVPVIDATVEVVAVADYSMYVAWGNNIPNLQLYLAHIVEMMNIHYTSMQNNDICISVCLAGIVIATSPISAVALITEGIKHPISGGGTGADASDTLTRLRNFLQPGPFIIPPYDHVMFFTRYSLTSGGTPGILGIAYVGTICQGHWSCSVVNANHMPTYVASTATHELGHCLGSDHDGQPGCPDNNYIMAASATSSFDFADNYFLFSCCSQDSFYETISGTSCLYVDTKKRNYPPSVDDHIANNLPGQVYDADDQCEMGFGTQHCSEITYINNGIDMCNHLLCVYPADPSLCTTAFAPAADGTVCGPGKWCYRGMCVNIGDSYLAPSQNCGINLHPKSTTSSPTVPTTTPKCVDDGSKKCKKLAKKCKKKNKKCKKPCKNPKTQKKCCATCCKYYPSSSPPCP